MEYLGIDCYSPLTRTQAEVVKSEGFSFVGRYLIPPEQYANGLSEFEAHTVSSAGLGLLTVFETQANRASLGYRAGKQDGKLAYTCARRIKMPEEATIYFAVDYQPAAGEYEAIAEYLTAASIEIAPYKIGVYGSFSVVEAMASRSACTHFWQCVGWSGGRVSDYRHIYQSDWSGTEAAKAAAKKIGVSVDINRCSSMEKAGIWMYEEDERMEINRILEKMTDEQAARIFEKAQNYFARMPLPGSWDAEGELSAAIKMGITDGTRPMSMATRLEAAAMIKRAVENLKASEDEEYCEGCDVEKILAKMEDDRK